MQIASKIYTQSIKHLSSVERLRLATLILEDLTEEQSINFKNSDVSALKLLESLPEKRLFQTANEVDEYLRGGTRFVGTISLPSSGVVYLDTAPVIYSVEKHAVIGR